MSMKLGRAIVVLFILSFLGLILNKLNPIHSDAQETEQTLQNLLNEINDNEITIITRFVAPIGDIEAWVIPEIITEGDLRVSRTLYEVGLDYLCVQESGEGSREIRCVPFSNIAEISYTRTD